MASNTYSFDDVLATLDGPGISVNLGQGAQVAEEGITISMQNERDAMRIGADGEGMHSMKMDKSGTITVRLLQTSPVNAALTAAYNAQSVDSSIFGYNVILIRNKRSGTTIAARDVAFNKWPDWTMAQEGQTLEWEFNAIKIDPVVGEF